MKKTIWAAAAVLLILALCLTGCSKKDDATAEEPAATAASGASATLPPLSELAGGPIMMSFSDAVSFDAIQKLNGQKVSIIGYMATLSPISGKYMYLMNMPYQSCPFCVPNTTQLSNTMAVYAPEGKTFAFTDQAIQVTGEMRVEDYTDEFGYEYNYRIVNAAYEEVDLSTVSEEYSLWQSIASDGIVAEVNSMFDYVYFLCHWPEYTSSYVDEAGNEVTFNLYAADAIHFLENESAMGYNQKHAEGYFPGLVDRCRAISATELEDLVKIIQDAQAVEQAALTDLYGDAFTYDEGTDLFTLNNAEALDAQWYEVYSAFSQWLAKWSM